jgi:gliding motility-associated-like protein
MHRILLILLGLMLICPRLSAQDIPEYNMQNLTVQDCDGILYDSGGPSGIYDNNENLVFTIQGVGPVQFTFFGQFCLEENLDFVTLYDGPNIGSPLLAGPFTGTTTPAGTFTANSGTLTILMTSDISVTYCGFSAIWNVVAPPPVPPTISIPAVPACGSTGFDIVMSSPVPCQSVSDAAVTLSTIAGSVGVTSVAPLGCVNNQTFVATVVLSQPISYNCLYNVLLDIGLPDQCDSIHNFELTTSFLENQCPINAQINVAQNPVCVGGCTTLLAQVASANCFTYTYSWNQGLPNGPGPHNVCPNVTTSYSVTITEVQTGVQSVFSVTVEVVDIDFAPTPTNFCSNEPPIALPANPPGGSWSGSGVNPDDPTIFDPGEADFGMNTLTYSLGGCSASVEVEVLEINAGGVIAACAGTAPFQLNGQPDGAVWLPGPGLTLPNTFNPAVAGQYVLTYTDFGCSDDLTINVDDIAVADVPSEICQSEPEFTINFAPFGGIWSGPGLVNATLGIFDPRQMPAGNVTLTYTAIGCSQNFTVFVKEINVGPKFRNACPANPPFVPFPAFAPPGGTWSGPGILNPASGLFSPGVAGENTWNELIYTAPNGCTDTIFMFVKQTEVPLTQLFFCEGDPNLPLTFDTVGSMPWGGFWTGIGVVSLNDGFFDFSPTVAGVGTFPITYSVNNCTDNMTMVVHPNALNIQNQTFCTNDPPVIFGTAQTVGGTWSGGGVNPQTGEFNPAAAGPGTYTITWTSPAGCTDSFQVTVELFIPAQITGLLNEYCFVDQSFDAGLVQPGGTFMGGDSPTTFNPSVAGAGTHTLIYTQTNSQCPSADTLTVIVHPELTAQLTASETVICPGQSSVLSVTAAGGPPGAVYSYAWNNGLLPISQHTVSPTVTTTFTVTLTDGCSDPVDLTVTIEVGSEIVLDVITSGEICFGEEGFALASASPDGNYQYVWQTSPPVNGPLLEAPAGTAANLVVTDLDSGCFAEQLVLIPTQPPVIANFSISPSVDCIPYEGSITLFDLSQNGTTGSWDVGGQIIPYVPGENPTVVPQSGNISVSLTIENDKGCSDSAFQSLCVQDDSLYFLPDIFSPNGDGSNDVLYVRARNVKLMTFIVYNRWGERVFRSENPKDGWDGEFRGAPSPTGVYAFWLEIEFLDGMRVEEKGNITLVR